MKFKNRLKILKPMVNIPEKSEIKTAINEYCSTKAISKNDLALEIGVSGATLSKIENESWQSINNQMWLKIWNHVRPVISSKLFQTQDFATIEKLCDNTKSLHLMTGLLGDTGTGKTTALKMYARKENCYYIYYDMNMRPKHFFFELGKLLGFELESNVYEMIKNIAGALNQKQNPLLIIDEAGRLSDQMLMALQVLRDKTIHNSGIVLAGMPYFKANLIKKANKQKTGISEFLRRIMIWNELEGLKQKEAIHICQTYGIDDAKELSKFKYIKRFSDLENEILLYKTLNNSYEN